MPDDPLQQRSPSSTSIPSNGNEPRFRNLLDDSPSVASLPIASTSRPTLEQLTRDVRGDQRYALIHPVGKQDTFASVALAYGCSQTVLRQSNKLWLSDPIHLRSELIIPLDACTKPPSKEVLVEAQLQLDNMTLCLSMFADVRPTGKPSAQEKASGLAAMAAARVADFTGPPSESSRGSSRGSSFDLLRIDQSFYNHSHSQASSPGPISSSGRSPSREASADGYLPSTNNIYACDQLDELAGLSVPPPPPVEDGSQTGGADLSQVTTSIPSKLSTRSYKVIEIPQSSLAFSSSPRPSLSSARENSFHLDQRLTSPPPTLSTTSATSQSTSAPPETWALSSKGKSGGWSAMDEDELEMAKDIMRHVGQGRAPQSSRASSKDGSRRRHGLSEVFSAWTS